MKKKYFFAFGRRAINNKKFYFFRCPLCKETMRQEGFIFFWWIGPYFLACQKAKW